MLARVVFLTVLAAIESAWADPLGDAYSQGGQLGRSGNAQGRGSVTGETARSTVPNYTTNPPQTSLYGSGGLGAPAGAAIANCALAPGQSSSYADQACNATNFSQSNPGQRPNFSIGPNDPLLVRSKTIANDPQAIAGNLAGTYNACTTQTVTTPDMYETRVCNQHRTMEQLSCQKLRTVQVSLRNSCTPGIWFGNFWVNTWGNGEVGSRFAGIAIDAYCEASDTLRMALHAICTEEPCSGHAEIQVDARSGAASPQTFTNFIGRSWFATDLFNRVDYKGGGCTAEQCSFAFCTRYEDAYTSCDDISCTTTPINETRSCGTFSFERPRSIATVTDSWDNQCAALEARTQ